MLKSSHINIKKEFNQKVFKTSCLKCRVQEKPSDPYILNQNKKVKKHNYIIIFSI